MRPLFKLYAGGLACLLACLACNMSSSVPPESAGASPVSILAPANNSQLAEGATLQIAIRAEDKTGPGVDRIEVTVDDQPLSNGQVVRAAGQPVFTTVVEYTATGQQGHLFIATAYRADNSVIGAATLTVIVVGAAGSTFIAVTPVAPNATIVIETPVLVATAATTATALPPTTTPQPAPTLTLAPPNQTTAPTTLPANSPQARIVTAFLNVRSGPGPTYSNQGLLKAGDVVLILGRNEERTWWAVQGPNGVRGWILNNPVYIATSGDLTNIPLAAARPSPAPTLTPSP